MKKKAILLLTLILIGSSVASVVYAEAKTPFNYNLYDDINRNSKNKTQTTKATSTKATDKTSAAKETSTGPKYYADDTTAEWETENIYYRNANLNSAVRKYQQGNYAGCLQEMISLTKIDPLNPIVYYYMGMAYTQVGNKDQAVKAYETVIKLNPQKTLLQYATRGRDCLVSGPTCSNSSSEDSDSDLDDFINSPYGNGFSEELNNDVKQQQLKQIQKTINNKEQLEEKDIEKIHKFDQKSEEETNTKVASNDDIVAAIETLKKAGITVSVNPYQTPEFNEFGMFFNNNNNNYSNMLPYLLTQHQDGKNIDPQIIQAMMMNSMLPDFTFSDNKNKY